jgi:hypothetical protein
MTEEQAKQIAKDVVDQIGDLLEQQKLIEKNQSYYMIDALRWISYQKWADNMPPALVVKHAILAVAAGLNKLNDSLPPMYTKGAMSKAKDIACQLLNERHQLSLDEV